MKTVANNDISSGGTPSGNINQQGDTTMTSNDQDYDWLSEGPEAAAAESGPAITNQGADDYLKIRQNAIMSEGEFFRLYDVMTSNSGILTQESYDRIDQLAAGGFITIELHDEFVASSLINHLGMLHYDVLMARRRQGPTKLTIPMLKGMVCELEGALELMTVQSIVVPQSPGAAFQRQEDPAQPETDSKVPDYAQADDWNIEEFASAGDEQEPFEEDLDVNTNKNRGEII